MRPIEYGQAKIDSDIVNITRILRRAVNDMKRPEKDRKLLQRYLKGALTILINGKRNGKPKVD